MKTIFTLLFVGLLAGVLFTGTNWLTPGKQMPQAVKSPTSRTLENKKEPPTVTQDQAGVPKINYVEQVRDMRRDMERRQHIKTIHHNKKDKSHYVEREVVVHFTPRPSNQDLQKMLRKVDGYVKRDFKKAMIIKSRTLSTEQLMRYFAEHPDSVYAEPNYLLLPNKQPNDTYYKRYQWNLNQLGMEQSWEITEGSSQVIVAVVDTGVDLTHPEFKGKLVNGYNVLNGSKRPQDDNGHGTHVAGIIAARTNNQDGIAGISWKSKIMPIKAIGADGSGSAIDIAQGIEWAVDHGASIINLSVGNYVSSAALKAACTYADQNDVVLVAATGNDASEQPSYPAAFPEVIGVSAVDQDENLAEFSNYGKTVSVVAPGVDIPSTYIYKDYAALSGTSMACPHVAAVASLIRSVNPSLSNKQVRQILEKTATDLGAPGRDSLYGYGYINVKKALQESQVGQETAPLISPAATPSTENQAPASGFQRFLELLLGRYLQSFRTHQQ
ncbi:peptidase S8 [Brevibacillus sp. SKDU10]|uniref:S8 family peptidase n=1 Tax=Brevibacillus sp. SKDU10 TaxID=1247872 RepID=UPI0007C8F421|nr:S8 family peptidase [Brevibacillus sp. SKDU10]OAJ73416.1 peptidase S8 [Brevibacillus sp. SKDU10]